MDAAVNGGFLQTFSLLKVKRATQALSMSFKEFFKVRWEEFLKENFRSPEEIGVAFNVTSVTAQNWLDGATSTPTAGNLSMVSKAQTVIPG